MNVRHETFRSAHAFMMGLSRLRRQGATPRSLLFLALDHAGGIHLAVPDDPDAFASLRVGEKLTLAWPFAGRFFYYDSIHRLPGVRAVVVNGDRRLSHPGNSAEVAEVAASFLKFHAAPNVFFGCTPHQPGCWLLREEGETALHERGLVEAVFAPQGLLARKVADPHLWFAPHERVAEPGAWKPVYASPLGSVLMLERRIQGGRLALSCERGLVEVDVTALPHARETLRAARGGGVGVVGRLDGGAFVVTRGRVELWGLDDIAPAQLVGAEGTTLAELAQSLDRVWTA